MPLPQDFGQVVPPETPSLGQSITGDSKERVPRGICGTLMVRSDIGHLFDDYEASRVEPIQRTFPDGSARTDDSFRGNHPNPEEELLHGERVRLEMTALDLIREAVEGKSELESVFLALFESDSSKEIAQLTGLPIERVYSLRRELTRIAVRITPARVAQEAMERRKHG
jgi:hypothetical protein